MIKLNSNINISNKEYSELVDSKAEKTNIKKNLFMAFVFGGTICIIGQIVTNIFLNLGYDQKTSSTICTIFLIFLGAFLTSINVYSKIGKIAGAGSIIPITGFSNSIVAPAIEFKSEGYILGLGVNMFKVAGPVLVYGITTSFFVGIIYYFLHVIM